MAPEILDPERYGYTRRARSKLPSKSTDIYALGMTILEVRLRLLFLLHLSRNLIYSQVITGRRPFEHTNPDAAVIQKVLNKHRPERPPVGFSESLWKLLIQMWLEEYESLPPTRPNITVILEQLQDEAENWNPKNRLLAPPIPMERKTSGTLPHPLEPGRTWLTRKSQRRVPWTLSGFRINSCSIRVRSRHYALE